MAGIGTMAAQKVGLFEGDRRGAAFEEAYGDDDGGDGLSSGLSFTVRTRGYEAVSSEVAALYGTWSHVVEPLRTATFEAVGACEDASLSWRIAKLERRVQEAASASSTARTPESGFSARTWAPFDASHEWDESKESIASSSGSTVDLTCGAVHDRYRVTLVETSADSSLTKAQRKSSETVVDTEPWMNVDADGVTAKRSSRRRRVATSDAVVCKYVRRELRALAPDDRAAYFGALEAVHRLSSSDGVKQHGPKFRSQKAFLLKHLGEDTVKGCTVFHGADSFLTGHAAFTLELEQALQAIDPSIAAPYWDTSLDDAHFGADWSSYAEKDLFSDSWLGKRTGDGGPRVDYPALTSGRFAFVEIPSVSDATGLGGGRLPPERNAYGRLTQSYNNDPATFLWRSDSVCGLPSKLRLPGCEALKGVLKETSVSDFRAKLETDWHGVLHPTLGGAFDCGSEASGESYFADLATTAPQLVQFVHQLAEVLWDVTHAAGFAVCPESCDGAFDACRCKCPAVDADLAAGNATAAYAFLDRVGILSRYAGSQRGDVFVKREQISGEAATFCFAPEPRGDCLTGANASKFMVALARLSCSPGRVAPYMTPLAASNDPLFWVTHASFEKLWAFKRLTNDNAGEAAAGGGPASDDDVAALGDENNVDAKRARPSAKAAKDALKALDIETDVKTFDETWDWHNETGSKLTVGAYCLGKAWHDPTPFSNFLGETDDAFYTNADLYALFDPTNARLPYVFDDMSWAHCRSSNASQG